jgi:hypothetical protein
VVLSKVYAALLYTVSHTNTPEWVGIVTVSLHTLFSRSCHAASLYMFTHTVASPSEFKNNISYAYKRNATKHDIHTGIN